MQKLDWAVMPRGREINPRREKSQEEEQIRGGEGRRTLSPEEHRVLSQIQNRVSRLVHGTGS